MLHLIEGDDFHRIMEYVKECSSEYEVITDSYRVQDFCYSLIGEYLFNFSLTGKEVNHPVDVVFFNIDLLSTGGKKVIYDTILFYGSIENFIRYTENKGFNIFLCFNKKIDNKLYGKLKESESVIKKDFYCFRGLKFFNYLKSYINNKGLIIDDTILEVLIETIKNTFNIKNYTGIFLRQIDKIIFHVLHGKRNEVKLEDIEYVFGLFNEELNSYNFFERDKNITPLYKVQTLLTKVNKIINYFTGYTKYNGITKSNKIGQIGKRYLKKDGNQLSLDNKIVELNENILKYISMKQSSGMENLIIDKLFITSLYNNLHK